MTDRPFKTKDAKAADNGAAIDIPEADVAEQRRDLLDEDENGSSDEPPAPYDADPADAAEQRIEVGFDDDEYR